MDNGFSVTSIRDRNYFKSIYFHEPGGVLIEIDTLSMDIWPWSIQKHFRAYFEIINDDVMGGVSQSEIIFNDTGTATFQGRISLENNGGFASIRSNSHSYRLGGYVGLHVRIKGDGKDYQLRVRTDNRLDGISYRYRFAYGNLENRYRQHWIWSSFSRWDMSDKINCQMGTEALY